MKCILNDKDIFELNPTQLKLLQHIMPVDQVEDTIKGLMHYVIGQKLREAAGKLFEEWKPKLAAEGVTTIPLMDIDLAEIIFNHKDYAAALSAPIAQGIPE